MTRVKKVSLAERMGKKAMTLNSLSLDDLPELLGDGMPHLQFTQAGRLRLLDALRQRFGDGFMNLPHVQGLVHQFDAKSQDHVTMAKLRNIRPRG